MKKLLLCSAVSFAFIPFAFADHHVANEAPEMVKETITTIETNTGVVPTADGTASVTTETVETVVKEKVPVTDVVTPEAAHGAIVTQPAQVDAAVGDGSVVDGAAVSDVVSHEEVVVTSMPMQAGAHWGYGNADGASKWAGMDAAYETCKSGMEQSPINIDKFLQEDLPDILPAYQDVPLSVVNNGHTVQVNFPAGSGFRADNIDYGLVRVHFHTPSEHYLDGAPYPMEAHFVHQNAQGGVAVIAVMMKVGEAHPTIEGIWQNVPAAGEIKDVTAVQVNAANLMPASLEYYKYQGSLTEPPCSEGVTWYVMKEPIELSEGQLTAFQSVFPVNARPVQPLNERVVTGD